VGASKRNARIVLIAFAALFNKRDYAQAERLWSPNYIQHSAEDPLGLFDLVTSRPRLTAI
jgi:predicted SnoaL-like aldol condensation-catalyzing enzyme